MKETLVCNDPYSFESSAGIVVDAMINNLIRDMVDDSVQKEVNFGGALSATVHIILEFMINSIP